MVKSSFVIDLAKGLCLPSLLLLVALFDRCGSPRYFRGGGALSFRVEFFVPLAW